MHMYSNKLTLWISIGLFLGALVGLLLQSSPIPYRENILNLAAYGGNGFIQLLKFIAIPLVFTSMVGAIINLGSIKLLGRIGLKTLTLFFLTTLIAVTNSLIITSLIGPKFDLPTQSEASNVEEISLSKALYESLGKNPIDAIIEGNMVQIIFFGVLTGIILMILFRKNAFIKKTFDWIHKWIIGIIILVMYVAPLGIFCLMIQTFYTLGLDALLPIFSYFLMIVLMLSFQALVVYPIFLNLAGISAIKFYKKIKNILLVASTTASSNATLPVTLETAEKELKVNPEIASFIIPLGATINMDALAAAYGVASVFLANSYGIDLSLWQYITIIILTIIASVGTAGIPGVGLLALSMVLQQANIPIEGIPLLMSVSRFGDMIGTAVNVTGDVVVTCIVAKSEGMIDKELFK